MDFKVNHELIPLTEVIYDGIQEQSIELDYILPDYYPDIFRLVKCETIPHIVSYNLTDDMVSYELCADINILYCSEGSSQLNVIKQKFTYSKTLEARKGGANPEISLKPKVDYVNCRVVNQRRLDIRGVVTTKIKAINEKSQEMICDAYGLNVQMKKCPVEYALGKLSASKIVNITEETELGTSKPPIIAIVKSYAVIRDGDKKIIANKLVAKGSAEINVLYSCEISGQPSMETMKFTVPYSQILDINGLDETYRCYVKTDTVTCDVVPMADKDGNMTKLQCELAIWISCSAVKTAHAELITDIYSTRHPCEFSLSKVRISQTPVSVNEQVHARCSVDNNASKVYDIWCNPGNAAVRIDEDQKEVYINGMVQYAVMMQNEEGMPVFVEKDGAYEHKIGLESIEKGSSFEADIKIEGCTYNLSSNGSIIIDADILICGKLYKSSEIEAVTAIDINADEIKPKEGDYAIKLYFGTEGESVWNIARKYSTSVKAVMEENDLYDEKLTGNSMLLIPIVN